LTTVVSRVCLDILRSRKSRREDPTGAQVTEPRVVREEGADPEGEAVLADSVGVALLDQRRLAAEQSEERVMNETPRIFSVHGVRYQVTDVARAVAFYTNHLGFRLEQQHLPAFASVSLEDLMLLLSGPGASGSRPMPGGESQQPGGWNRVVLRVADLPAEIDALKNAGGKFRNQMEAGPFGRQIQVEDPDGNPIELFQPAQ